MDGGKEPYPKRLGEPDCRYYMNTGFCKFRTTCRFNHPLDREQVAAKDEYPERLGQAECQHYLKTGFCKFGAVCKYHHPREKARSTSPVNFTPGEECAIFSQSGWCKDGATCQFHHPHTPLPLPEPSSSNSEMSVPQEVEQMQSSEIHTSRQEMTEICSKTMDRSEPTTQSAAHEFFPTGNVSCNTRNLGTSCHGTSNQETSNAVSSSSKLVSSHDDVQTQELKISEPRTKLERQIEASKLHWTELSSHSDSTGNGKSNREIYESLLQYPAYEEWFKGQIGVDFADMVLGQKLAEGGEAEIYEVKFGRMKPSKINPRFVLKVFKEGYSLRDFQKQWLYRLPTERIVQGGVVMDDDRFAYLLRRKAIDLRKLIEVAQEDHFPLWNGKQTRLEHLRTYEPKSRSHGCSMPIFSIRCARKIMFSIAWNMMHLHSDSVVHRDLKSSNVLCSDWELDDDRGFSPKKWIYCEVADYESSTGVVGTGFWRAPEILLQLKEKNPEVHFTREADVFSFAMVCYEIFTGHVPFEGYESDDYGDVLNGVRPTLPNHVPIWIQDLIRKCWHQDPLERPNFDDIWQQILNEDQLDEWKHIGYNPIMKGPNISARVPLEGPENSPFIPSNEVCMICEKKRTHSN